MVSFRTGLMAMTVATWTLTLLPAAADPWSDDRSGLRVDPPAGYAVTALASSPPFTVRVAVKEAGDRDTGCQVAFEPLPQNARLTQAEINKIAGEPDWRERARWSIISFSDVSEEQAYSQDGISGLSLVAEMKPSFAAPDRAKNLRHFMTVLETPKGRTTTVCTAEKANFEARRTGFLEVVRGVEPPRP